MMKRFFFVSFLFFIALVGFDDVNANGKIRGIVTDASTGEPLIGANVVFKGTTQGTATDINGEYIIINVDPGVYTLLISYIGYIEKEVQGITIQSGLTRTLDIQMQPDDGTMMEAIVVTAEKPLLQKDQTGTQQTVSGAEIKELPVQNFSEVLGYQAGVISEGRNSFNVRGGRSNEVAFLVDGILVRDPVNGALATNINYDAIEELNFLSGTFNAEYGNAMSGVVNISTKEGGNNYSGTAEFRRSGLNTPSDSLFRRVDFQAVNYRLDGPIIKDKLTFATTGEVFNEENYTPFGFDRGNNFFGKLTWNAFKGTKVNASIRSSYDRYKNYNHSYKYIPDSVNYNKATSLQGLFSMTNSFSSKMVLTTRFSYFNQTFFNGLDKPNEDYIQAVTYLNDTFVGEFFSSADPTSKQETNTTTYSLRSDLLWQLDSYNEMKLGFQFQQHVVDWYEILNIAAVIPYVTDIRGRQPYEGAVYLQDKIERNAFVLNLGLRLDFANQQSRFREDPLDPDTEVSSETIWQLSPRIGIAHPISSTSILRFSYGRFFQNPDFRFVYENNFYEFGTREPLFGSPDLDAQRTTAYEIGLVQQVSSTTAVKFTAYYKDIRGLIGTEYIPQGASVNGRAAFTSYSIYVNEDYANVRGAEINVDSRFHKNMDAIVTYTYSIAKGSSSSALEGFPRRLPATRLFPLNFDKTHLFNLRFNVFFNKEEGGQLGRFHPLQHTRFNLVFFGSSGYPYTPSGRDIGFVEPNSERYPITWQIDLFAKKRFYLERWGELETYVNITNLTDRRNARFVYSDTGEPDEFTITPQSQEWILNPRNFFEPRNILFGVRYFF